MGPAVAGISYLTIAIYSAWVINPNKNAKKWKFNAILYWIIMAFVMFLIPYKYLVLLISAILLLLFRSRSNADNVLFYICVFPSVPLYIKYSVPFPGVDHLIIASFLLIAPLCLLFGKFVFEKTNSQLIEIPMLIYFAIVISVSFTYLPFTSGLRYGVTLFLIYLLPFLALARVPMKIEGLMNVFDALLTLSIILGCIAIISQLVKWNIYGYFDHDAKIFKHQFYRYGFLRVETTTTSTTLAFLAACGFVAMSVTKGLADTHKSWRIALMGVFSLTIFFSMARGGWLSALVMLLVYSLLLSRKSNSTIIAVLIGASMSVFLYFQYAQFADVDPYGTFEYRRELYKAATIEFFNNPIFGDINYISSGNFDHLYQGEGIIDIVSIYIDVLLGFGVVGFALYFSCYFIVLYKLFNIRGKLLNSDDDVLKKITSASASIIISYLTMIGTISSVLFVSTVGYIILGLGYAVVREIEHISLASPTPAGSGA